MAGHLTHEADPNYYLTPAESPPSLACEEPADERVEGDGVDFPYFVLCGDRASGKTTILEAVGIRLSS
jgi:predicted ABC-class ATPase